MRILIVLFMSITTAAAAPGTDPTAQKVDRLFTLFATPSSPSDSQYVSH